MIAALLAAALSLSDPARSADPLAGPVAEMGRDGYALAERASTRVTGGRLEALVFDLHGESQALRVYRVRGGKASLVFLEPNPSARIALSSIHEGGKIPDLAGDGSRIIAYSLTFSGAGEQVLVLLRAAGGKVRRLASFPFGAWRDLDGDGRMELISRDRPLGQFFSLECESFRTMAQTAFHPRVFAWRGARLAPASGDYPAYLEGEASRLEGELAGRDPRSVQDYGGYLGSALSLFFVEQELGRGREAWRRFLARFPVRATDPPAVRRCLRDMDGVLRQRLSIPSDW